MIIAEDIVISGSGGSNDTGVMDDAVARVREVGGRGLQVEGMAVRLGRRRCGCAGISE